MKKITLLLKTFCILIIVTTNINSASLSSFDEGKKLFDNKKYEESKFFFEKDIVFNPKKYQSYLYLAKIFENAQNDVELEKNLNTTLLLEPNNDEAIYMLIILKMKQSNYEKSRELIEKFDKVCVSFCSKKNEIKIKFEKLIPDNEQTKNK